MHVGCHCGIVVDEHWKAKPPMKQHSVGGRGGGREANSLHFHGDTWSQKHVPGHFRSRQNCKKY
jgi:hypothetical protein